MSNVNYRWKVNLGQEPVNLEAAGVSGGLCEASSVSLVDEKAGEGIPWTKLRLGYCCVWSDEGGWSPLGNQP